MCTCIIESVHSISRDGLDMLLYNLYVYSVMVIVL